LSFEDFGVHLSSFAPGAFLCRLAWMLERKNSRATFEEKVYEGVVALRLKKERGIRGEGEERKFKAIAFLLSSVSSFFSSVLVGWFSLYSGLGDRE
jgi:uncharacterized membrane protein YbaN (DUF454 family)